MSVNVEDKENRMVGDEASRQHELRMERRKLAGTKIPGVFTHKKAERVAGDQTLEEIVKASLVYQQSLKQWIGELEGRVGELSLRNDVLVQQAEFLKRKNRKLKEQLVEVEYENELLRSRPTQGQNSILSYLSKDRLMEIVQQPEPGEVAGLEGSYMRCWTDNNSNVRAFYLSMLQYPETRQQLRRLMEELQLDDSYKVLPLLDTNEFWMQISENFVEVLDRGEFDRLDEIFEYLNKCILLDLIFVSALRSRVEFMSDSYDSPIENLQLYTVMSNNFGFVLTQELSTNYESFRFQADCYSFSILITDTNSFLVRFEEVHRSLQTSEYDYRDPSEFPELEQQSGSEGRSNQSGQSQSNSQQQKRSHLLRQASREATPDVVKSFSDNSLIM